MEIKTTDKHCIITPLSPKLGLRETERIVEEIKNNSFCEIGLDLSFVNECSNEFIDNLKQFNNLSLFNISSDIFVVFNCMKLDKIFNLFVSELDFKNSKHRLLNREFTVVGG